MQRHLPRWFLCCSLLLGAAVQADPVAQPGFVLQRIDGKSQLGEHYAVIPGRFSDKYVGLLYLAEEARLYQASCDSNGCRIGRALSAEGRDRGRHVSAAMRPGTSPKPFVASYDAGSGDLVGLSCSNDDCSFGGQERVLDGDGDVGQYTAIGIDAATGAPLIGYYDAGNGDLKLYVCANTDCSSGSARVVDGAGDRGRHAALAYGNGTLWIAYDDSSSGEIRLASATAPYDSFSLHTLGSGTKATLQAAPGGGVDIAWEGAEGDLMFRHCTNATCAGTASIALTGANLGRAPSLTRLPNGRPFVSHHDSGGGAVMGTLCGSATCDNGNQLLVFENGPGMGARSVALGYADGRPLAIYRDANQSSLRMSECTTTACSAFNRRLAVDGIATGSPGVGMRADGRAVLTWVRRSDRQPHLAVCADATCTQFSRRVLGGSNSDSSTPAVAIRPDDRPFAYFASVGGTAAWDCNDAECSSGNPRTISAPGTSTSTVSKMALRPDGRPVLLYYHDTQHQIFLYVCADLNCSGGQARLVVDAGESLRDMAVAVGSDNRPLVVYSNGAGQQTLARCEDSECASFGSSQIDDAGGYAYAFAVRGDQRPVLVSRQDNTRELRICDTAACSGSATFPLPNWITTRSLAVLAGDRPLYDYGTSGSAGVIACADPTCSTREFRTAMADAGPGASFEPALAVGADGRLALAAHAQRESDVWLAVTPPVVLFGNGFE